MSCEDVHVIDTTLLIRHDVKQRGSHAYFFANVANKLKNKDVIHDHDNPKSLAQ